MKYVVTTAVLLLALFLQTTFFSLHFVLGVLLLFTILFKENSSFIFAFAFGILIDVLSFHVVGISSLLFVVFVGLIFLYQRKYQVESPFFVGISIFLFSLIEGMIFSYFAVLETALVNAILFTIVYFFIDFLANKKHATQNIGQFS